MYNIFERCIVKKEKILFIFIMCIFLAGCRKNNDIESEQTLLYDLQKVNKNFKLVEKDFICNELNEKSIVEGNIFVSDKKIYSLSLQKIYSNGSNCIEIGELQPDRYAKYISRGKIVDNTGGIYRQKDKARDDDYNPEKEEYKYDDSYKSNIVELYGYNSIFSGNNYANDFYRADVVIFNGENLIGYYSGVDTLTSYDEIINIDNILNEKIIFIYGYIIKTDKNFYIVVSKKVNADECDKYADIKCKYEYYLEKSNILSNYYDLILNINGSTIITKKSTYIDFYDINLLS